MSAQVKRFFRYAVPSVVSMWVFSIYTMADGIFVAQGVGETALAAVNIAMPFINAIFALSLWFAVGTSTLIAISMGKGDQRQASAIFTMNTVMLVVVSAIVTLLALTHLDKLAAFLGATELTADYVQSYLRIIILFSVCFIVSYCLEVLIKTDGFPVLATLGVCASALTNIVLDYFFVIRFNWGVEGAAIATGFSQLVLLVVFIIHFTKGKSTLKFVPFDWQLLSSYKRILPIGFSDCITEFSTGIVTFMFNRTILATLGENAIVSYTIITYVNTLVLMTMIGITQGMQPLVSFSHGQRDISSVHRLLRYGLTAVVGCALLAFGLCQLLAEPLVSVFIRTEHQELFVYSIYALKLFAFSFLLLGFNVVIAGFFAAIEQPMASLIISLSRGLILVPVGLAVTICFWGADLLWIATVISEALTLIITFILLNRRLRHNRQIVAAKQPRS